MDIVGEMEPGIKRDTGAANVKELMEPECDERGRGTRML